MLKAGQLACQQHRSNSRRFQTQLWVPYNKTKQTTRKMKKEQRHTTDKKPDIYFNYYIKTNISNCNTDLLQGNVITNPEEHLSNYWFFIYNNFNTYSVSRLLCSVVPSLFCYYILRQIWTNSVILNCTLNRV